MEKLKPYENMLAVPGVFALFLLLRAVGFSGGLLMGMFAVPIHELGHAVVAWTGGRAAIPTFFFVTISSGSQDRSPLIWGCGVLFVMFLLWRCIKGRYLIWSLIFAITFLFQLHFFFGKSEVFEKWIKADGIAAEFWLSTLCICLFYYRVPESWNWNPIRYFLLIAGAFTFQNSFFLWRAAKGDHSLIPWGSAVGGEDDSNGDLNSLNEGFGWSVEHILSFYNQLGTVCLIIIIAHYLVFFFQKPRADLE